MAKKKINNIKDVFEQFDDIIKPGKSPFAAFNKDKNTDNTKKKEVLKYYKFQASKSVMNGGIVGLVILMAALALAIPAIIELNFHELKFVAKIIQFAIMGIGVLLAITMNKRVPIILEIFETHIKVANDIPVGSKIDNMTYFIKLMRNKFAKTDIPLSYIQSIIRDKSHFSNGVIMINGVNGNGQRFSFHSALALLEKRDLNKMVKILSDKGVKNINV